MMCACFCAANSHARTKSGELPEADTAISTSPSFIRLPSWKLKISSKLKSLPSAVTFSMLSHTESTRKRRFFGSCTAFLPKSHTKWLAVPALPPLPMMNTCLSSNHAWRKISTALANSGSSMAQMASVRLFLYWSRYSFIPIILSLPAKWPVQRRHTARRHSPAAWASRPHCRLLCGRYSGQASAQASGQTGRRQG